MKEGNILQLVIFDK